MRRIAGPPHQILLLLTLVLCGISRAPSAFAAPWPPPGGGPPASQAAAGPHPRWIDGEVLISFRPDARPQDMNAILKDIGAKRVRKFKRTPGERDKIQMPVADAVAKYKHHPALRYIEPNYIVHADAVPNDPLFPIQWSLRNTGQQSGTPGVDIHATGAWDQTTGSNQVIVAIVDTGMDMDHPDLVGNLYTNQGEIAGNLLDDDGNGYVDDVHGFDFANFDGDPDDDNSHGTHVAGTVGAVGNNGIGIAGVVWNVRLLPLKFLDANGSGTTGDAVDCIDYAVAAGATVINASWGGGDDSFAMREALQQANAAGVLFVAAAGNASANTDLFDNWPGNYPYDNIISVASSDRADNRSGFSNYGPATVDLFAPGTQIVSTVRDGQYAVANGTSMAAPHVSGAIALLKSRFPAMNAATMKKIILATTDRVPALAGLCVTGGRLGVQRMLEGLDSIPPNPPANLALSNASSDRVTVRWTAPGDDGAQGTATEYDLRISDTPIDDTNFLAATRVAGPAPHVAGTLEEAVIRGLTPLTGYYVAAVAMDEFGNRSPLSNVVFAQTTPPPTASVQPGSVISNLRTGQTETRSFDLRNDGAGMLDFTARAMGSGGGAAPPWLRIDPLSGTVAAGALVPVSVTFQAAGLRGGDYMAAVRLTTNDPAHPTIDVTVALHVTSAPDIEIFPFPLPFGPVAVGETAMQGLLVTNAGFDDLHVTSVSASGDGFSVDETPFDLPPGASWEITATIIPTHSGPLHGILVIECDDPDEPSIQIPMEAQGIVPATIEVTPARESSALHTGQTATRTFTITNGGGSSLSWTVRTRTAGTLEFDSTGAEVPPLAVTAPKVTASAVEEQATDISDVRIVFDSRHGGSPGFWGAFIGSLVSRGALFSVNTEPITDAVLSQADVYWISDGAGAFTLSERAALAAWVRRGGSLLIEGEASAAPEFNALLDSLAVPVKFEANQGITGFSTRIYPYEITRGVTAANLPSMSRLHVLGEGPTVVVEDAQGFPAEVAAFVGRGRVLAVGGRFFADVSAIFVDNRKIAAQSIDWLGGAAWLSVTPDFGNTAPGHSSTVTARFDASQLAGADYRAAIVFVSNDPVHSKFLVPVDLALTPATDIEVAPLSLDLGAVFVGASAKDSVRVQNDGVLPLRISSVTVDRPDLSASPSSLALSPGQVGWIVVTYAPGAVGPAAGTLSIESDDPDEHSISVSVAGSGIPAPDVEITADSLTASLATGLSTTRTLTVRNRAGSDLDYFVHFEEEASATGPAAAATREDALSRNWAEAKAWAASNTSRVSLSPKASTPSTPTTMAAPGSADLPLVLVDPRHDGGVIDVLFFRASARGGELVAEVETGIDILPANFGGYISLDLDQNQNTGRAPSSGAPRQDIGAEYELGFFSLDFGLVDLFDAHSGNYVGSVDVDISPRKIRFSVPLSALNNDDGRMNVSGVMGNAVEASDWFPQRGHGTINGLWTAASPASGTLPAGTEQAVRLSVDALGLSEGLYRGNVVVDTNDPDELRLEVPASLQVTNGPWIMTSNTSGRIDLGQLFLGNTSTGEFVIGNKGTSPLHGSIAIDSTEFTTDVATFTIEPGAAQPVHVAFTAASPGGMLATLTVTHDAPGPPITLLLTGEGLIPPVLAVSPDSIATTVPLGGSGSVYLAVENRGGSLLTFGIEPMNRVAPVPQQEALSLARDEEDPRPPIHAADAGGPDVFGYRWRDSHELGGPVFDWVEISGIGTAVPITRLDQNSGPLPIGFTFPFYDRTFTTFNVCTHGYITFSDTNVVFANQPLPSIFAPPNLLAIFWDDLNFAGVEHAYYHNDGTRLIVEFQNVLRRAKGGPFTFEAILYPSGAIVYQYLLMGGPTNSGTIGIQNRSKTDGLTALFNGEGLNDRTAIRLSAAPGWLTVHQRSGLLDPGGRDSVQVAMDVRQLFAGVYDGLLRVTSNDPARPEKIVPVRLRARGIPDILVSATTLRFDTLFVGESAEVTFRVTNQGTDRLEASITGPPDYAAIPASLDLAPLQSVEVRIRFAPAVPGNRSATLVLSTNDPDMPLVSIAITAAARYRMRELLADVSPSPIPRGGRGKGIRARIVLPSDLDAARVVLPEVRLQGTVAPNLAESRVLDLNGDGHADLDLAFDREAVGRVLPAGDLVAVAITGEVRGATLFTARDSVRVVGKKTVAPGVELEDDLAPAVSALHPNAPNPFAAATAFRFDLAAPGPATVRVYSANGRLVRTLLASPLPAGRFLAGWDGRDDRGSMAPSGVYFVRLTVAGEAPFQTVRRWTRIR